MPNAVYGFVLGVHRSFVAQSKTSSYTSNAFFDQISYNKKPLEGMIMKWETPAYNDMRFGFEVTMYIYNR